MSNKTIISQELAQILTKSIENKMFGSVEIYFESGEITQITQRIIKKVDRKKDKNPTIQSNTITTGSKNNGLAKNLTSTIITNTDSI